MPLDVRADIANLRIAEEEAEEGEVQLPLARIPRTMQAEAERRGMDWWSGLSWGDAKRLHGQTLIDVPKTLVALYAELKLDVIAEIEEAEEAMEAGDSGPRELAWMRLSFMDAMVLNSSRAAGESQTQSVARRIRQAQDNQWEALWQDATARHEKGVPERAPREEREKKTAARVEDLAHAGQARRAARAVHSASPAITDPGRLDELRGLFPGAEVPPGGARAPGPVARRLPPEWTSPQGAARVALMKKHVERALRRPARRSAPGPFATRPEHLEVLRNTEDGIPRLAELIDRLALGLEPRAVTRAHAIGQVIATSKPNGGIRPLIMSSIFRRVGLGAVARVTREETMAACGPYQLGVGARDGCVKAFHSVEILALLRPGKAIMACDVGAAHQSLHRPYMMDEVRELCPVLGRPLAVWYPQDEPTSHWWKIAPGDVREIRSERGLDQGCPLASPAYGVATARPAARAMDGILSKDATASFFQYADDTQVHIDPEHLGHAHQCISREWERAGLSLNIGKTKVWTQSSETPLGEWAGRKVDALRCLGADLNDDGVTWAEPIIGSTGLAELDAVATKLTGYAARLAELRTYGLSVQLSQALLRYAAVGGPQHILMCKRVAPESAAVYDARIRALWEDLMAGTLPDDIWGRASLPKQYGGLAPGTLGHRASAAYLTASLRTLPEVLRRTGFNTAPGLRAALQPLDSEWAAAVADLVAQGVPQRKIPFAEDGPERCPRQKDLVDHIYKREYDERLAVMDDLGKARMRSASGAGSAAFLLLPKQQDHRVEDALFRVAVVRRLGGRVVPKGDDLQPKCALAGARGRCSTPLENDGIHANQCKCGGYVVRRHDRVVRWLARWIEQRVESDVLMEQVPPCEGEPDGRLDLTFGASGQRVWIDVAIVTTLTTGSDGRSRRANQDGAAARHAELGKRRKYGPSVTPFVMEALGRPGDIARSVLGRFAADRGQGTSVDVSEAWQSISALIQSESANLELRACGYSPSDWSQFRCRW